MGGWDLSSGQQGQPAGDPQTSSVSGGGGAAGRHHPPPPSSVVGQGACRAEQRGERSGAAEQQSRPEQGCRCRGCGAAGWLGGGGGKLRGCEPGSEVEGPPQNRGAEPARRGDRRNGGGVSSWRSRLVAKVEAGKSQSSRTEQGRTGRKAGKWPSRRSSFFAANQGPAQVIQPGLGPEA